MMWDFGDQTYTPGESQQRPRSVGYAPQQSTYPPLEQPATPFMPLARSIAPRYEPSSSYSSTHSRSYDMSGGDALTTRRPVEIDITYSSHHHHHAAQRPRSHSSAHHHHSAARPVVQSYPHSSSYQPPAQAYSHSSSHVHQAPVHYNPPAAQPAPEHHFFQYSKCTGRKKALCIGINYRGMKEQLHGCINDAKNVANFLIKHWGYPAGDIVLLSDDATDPRQRPTRENMIDAMHWLVKDAHQHDSLFFHYSGHGSQVKDKDGDEVDGYDEVIIPLDFHQKGIITDDLMHEIMVTPLPAGCRLTAVFDSCHSGTALDLPYVYHSNGRLKGHSSIHPRHREKKSSPADVISFSGCKDSQSSADTYENGVPVGAMSYAFSKSLRMNHDQTYQELLLSVRQILKEKYSQKPQLSSSHRIDTNLKFIL